MSRQIAFFLVQEGNELQKTQDEANSFMQNVKVIDVKFQITPLQMTIMVIYEKDFPI